MENRTRWWDMLPRSKYALGGVSIWRQGHHFVGPLNGIVVVSDRITLRTLELVQTEALTERLIDHIPPREWTVWVREVVPIEAGDALRFIAPAQGMFTLYSAQAWKRRKKC